MKKFYIILSILFCVHSSHAQNSEIDSLKNALAGANLADTTKIDLYLKLSSTFFPISIDSSESYTKKAEFLSKLCGYYKIDKIYGNKGLLQYYAANQDSAHYYFEKALEKLDPKKDSVEISVVYSNYAISYENNLEKALEYNTKAISFVEQNDSIMGRLYFSRGVFYFHNNANGPAKKYFILGYEKSVSGNNLRAEGMTSRALAYMYRQENKIDSAKIFMERGLDLCERTKSPEICYRINIELGEFYDEIGQHDKAKIALLEANKHALARNKNFEVFTTYIMLARHETKHGDYSEASRYFQEFQYKFKQEEPIFYLGVNAYESWSELEAKRGNLKKSNELLKLAMQFKDSLYSKQNKEALAEADAKYEAEKKDKEIATQDLQLQHQENTILRKENQVTLAIFIGLCLLLSIMGLWFFFKQRQKTKTNEILALEAKQEVVKLESLIDGEEKERNRLAQDLHDGINGDLAVIKYKISSIGQKKLTAKEKTDYDEALSMLDNAVEQVRRISHNLAPPSLYRFDLIEAIEQFCMKQNTLEKVKISFQHFGNRISLKKENETAIYRIIQEIINNILKHSGASEAMVQINNHGDKLTLTVEDNGKGFDAYDTAKGIGLQNIKSRVDFLKADLDIDSSNKGTTVQIEMELDKMVEI
ncbi:MAG: sensor histidine kinase [Bacteroidota bacterium]